MAATHITFRVEGLDDIRRRFASVRRKVPTSMRRAVNSQGRVIRNQEARTLKGLLPSLTVKQAKARVRFRRASKNRAGAILLMGAGIKGSTGITARLLKPRWSGRSRVSWGSGVIPRRTERRGFVMERRGGKWVQGITRNEKGRFVRRKLDSKRVVVMRRVGRGRLPIERPDRGHTAGTVLGRAGVRRVVRKLNRRVPAELIRLLELELDRQRLRAAGPSGRSA